MIKILYENNNKYYKAMFTIETEDGDSGYIGYTNGDRWNGWATPYFTYDVANNLAADINKWSNVLHYDSTQDAFIYELEDEEPDIFEGENIVTTDGTIKAYPIGAYSWVWDTIDLSKTPNIKTVTWIYTGGGQYTFVAQGDYYYVGDTDSNNFSVMYCSENPLHSNSEYELDVFDPDWQSDNCDDYLSELDAILFTIKAAEWKLNNGQYTDDDNYSESELKSIIDKANQKLESGGISTL